MQALKHFEHKFYDVVTVGERGQVVIPAKARKQLGIRAGKSSWLLRARSATGSS